MYIYAKNRVEFCVFVYVCVDLVFINQPTALSIDDRLVIMDWHTHTHTHTCVRVH